MGLDLHQQLEEALRLKPDDAEAHNNLGLALRFQGKLDEALDHVRQALGIRPDFPVAQEPFASLRKAKEDHERRH